MGDLAKKEDTDEIKETGLATYERKFSKTQVKLIREIVSPSLSKIKGEERQELYFNMFMNYARRTGLDPMAKQLYALMIQDTFVIHTGIGGLRATALRTKEYAGKTKPIFKGNADFTYENKQYTAPHSCEMEVYRRGPSGEKDAFPAVCYWDEFYPGPRGYKWRTSPHLMLAKCTEAQCLKMGFEIELAGIELTDNIDRIKSEEAEQGVKFIRRYLESLPKDLIEYMDDRKMPHIDRADMGNHFNFNVEETGKAFAFLQNVDDETANNLYPKGFLSSMILSKKCEYDLEKLKAELEPFKEEVKE